MALEGGYLQAASGDAGIPMTAQQHRALIDALVIFPGVAYTTDLAVTQRGAGANFSVDVAAGHAFVAGTSVSFQGKYWTRNTATANVTIAAAPGSGTRYDLIYLQMQDKQAPDGGTLYGPKIDKVTGTVDAGLPAVPANAIPLAQVGPIVSSTVSITNSLITDLRQVAGLAGPAPLTADVAPDEYLASASYSNLPTAGPTLSNVWIPAGRPCLVVVQFVMVAGVVNTTEGYMSFAVSGATTLAASDNNAAIQSAATGESRGTSRMTLFTPTGTGLHTITAQYRSGVQGTIEHFSKRRLMLIR